MKHGVLVDRELLDSCISVLSHYNLEFTKNTLSRAIEKAPSQVVILDEHGKLKVITKGGE